MNQKFFLGPNCITITDDPKVFLGHSNCVFVKDEPQTDDEEEGEDLSCNVKVEIKEEEREEEEEESNDPLHIVEESPEEETDELGKRTVFALIKKKTTFSS
jgi:hypothetical protein